MNINQQNKGYTQALQYIDSYSSHFIQELVELCSFRSVAGDFEGLSLTSDWIVGKLESMGAEVKCTDNDRGIPIIFGKITGKSEKTLLIYNYYDVVSEGDLSDWHSVPFIPEIREGRLYARGVDSNKGNLLSRIHAVESYLNGSKEPPPVTIKFLIEGEEESGSPYLADYIKQNIELLSAKGCLWAAERKDGLGRPQIALGTKGILFLELRALAKRHEIHSSFATIAPNPAVELINILSGMIDSTGHCLLEGFYDGVKEPTKDERELLKALSLNEEKLKIDWGIKSFLGGKTGLDLLVKHLYEPTSTICGIQSGYAGEGTKTILPSEAIAKVDFRLVSGQRVSEIITQVQEYLEETVTENIEYEILAAMDPARTPITSELVEAAISASTATSSSEVKILPTSPASGHMGVVQNYLGAHTVAVGVGDSQSNPHGPNENISISDYLEGVHFVATLFESYSRI